MRIHLSAKGKDRPYGVMTTSRHLPDHRQVNPSKHRLTGFWDSYDRTVCRNLEVESGFGTLPAKQIDLG